MSNLSGVTTMAPSGDSGAVTAFEISASGGESDGTLSKSLGSILVAGANYTAKITVTDPAAQLYIAAIRLLECTGPDPVLDPLTDHPILDLLPPVPACLTDPKVENCEVLTPLHPSTAIALAPLPNPLPAKSYCIALLYSSFESPNIRDLAAAYPHDPNSQATLVYAAAPAASSSAAPDDATRPKTGTGKAAPTAATPSSTATVASAAKPAAGLSTGAKAGIGVGAALGALLLIALAAWLLLRRRRRRAAAGTEAEEKMAGYEGVRGGAGAAAAAEADADADADGVAAVAAGGISRGQGSSASHHHLQQQPQQQQQQGAGDVARKPVPAVVTVEEEGEGERAAAVLSCEETERWEEEERRLDEDIAAAERRRLGS